MTPSRTDMITSGKRGKSIRWIIAAILIITLTGQALADMDAPEAGSGTGDTTPRIDPFRPPPGTPPGFDFGRPGGAASDVDTPGGPVTVPRTPPATGGTRSIGGTSSSPTGAPASPAAPATRGVPPLLNLVPPAAVGGPVRPRAVPGSPEEIIAEYNRIQAAQAAASGGIAGAGGTGTTRLLPEKEYIQEIIKIRNELLKEELDTILTDVKEGKQSPQEISAALTTIMGAYGIREGSDEHKKLMDQYRATAGDTYRLYALRKGGSYDGLDPLQKALFKDAGEFGTQRQQFLTQRNALVQRSVDPLVQVYDVPSWDKLSQADRAHFVSPSDFFQRQSTAVGQMSAPEQDYLLKRQSYIDLDAHLSQLQKERAAAKSPAVRAQIDAEIKATQEKERAALAAYTSVQPQALSAAYARQAEATVKKIEELTAEAQGMEEGPEKRAKEREIANLQGQAQSLSFKSREVVGQLTFTEKLQELIGAYNEYSGLGQFSSLFIDDKDIAKRRQKAEDTFCDTIPIGGTACWTSKICKGKIDPSVGGLGIVAQTVSGEPRGAARVQADKTPPAIFVNSSTQQTVSLTLYKISYFLLNTNDKPMTYNLVFKAADGSTYRAFTTDKTIAAGASDSRMRTSMIVKYSTKEYQSVCIVFNPGIKRFNGGSARQLCSSIASYGGGPTNVPAPAPTPSQQAGTATSGGTGGGSPGTPSGPAPRPDFDGF